MEKPNGSDLAQVLLLSPINKGQNKVAILLLVPLVSSFPQGKYHKERDAPEHIGP